MFFCIYEIFNISVMFFTVSSISRRIWIKNDRKNHFSGHSFYFFQYFINPKGFRFFK